MNEALKSHYLKAMGVVQWRDRHHQHQSDFLCVECYHQHRLCGLFVLHLSHDCHEIDENQKKLLHNIAMAINVHVGEVKLILQNENISRENYDFIVIFGKQKSTFECEWKNYFHTNTLIITESLSALLETPSLKKTVWEDLKDIRINID